MSKKEFFSIFLLLNEDQIGWFLKNVTYCRNTVVTDLQLCCNTITVIKLLYFDMSNGDWCIKYLFLAYVYGHFICQKWIFYTPVKKITIYVQNLRMRYYFFLHMCKKNLLDWNCDSSSWFVYFFYSFHSWKMITAFLVENGFQVDRPSQNFSSKQNYNLGRYMPILQH